MGMQVNIEITIDEVENQMNIDLSGEEMEQDLFPQRQTLPDIVHITKDFDNNLNYINGSPKTLNSLFHIFLTNTIY